MKYPLSLLAGVLLIPAPVFAGDTVRVATWNIANLWPVAGEYLRPAANGGPGQVRTAHDYAQIAAIAKQLDADVVGLQEMGSPDAVRIGFPENDYDVIFSARFDADLAANPGKLADPKTRDIYTALALRKETVKVLRQEAISDLAITDAEGHPVRDGTAAYVEVAGLRFWAVALHLKSGCSWPADPATFTSPDKPHLEEACHMLARQIPILEAWLDAKVEAGEEVVLLGDFNRVFDRANEVLFADLDDGTPAGLDLFMVPYKQEITCNGHSSKPEKSIDYVITTKSLWQKAVRAEIPKIDVTSNVSDHCPTFLDLQR